MTNAETEVAIQNLIERMNRIEATVMQNRPVEEPLGSVLNSAIANLTRASTELASRLPANQDNQITLGSGYVLRLSDEGHIIGMSYGRS